MPEQRLEAYSQRDIADNCFRQLANVKSISERLNCLRAFALHAALAAKSRTEYLCRSAK